MQETKACSPGSERISGTRFAVATKRRCVDSGAANTSIMRRSEKEFIVGPSDGTGGNNAKAAVPADTGMFACEWSFVTNPPLQVPSPRNPSDTWLTAATLLQLVLPLSWPHFSVPPPWPPRLGAFAREALAPPRLVVSTREGLVAQQPSSVTSPSLSFGPAVRAGTSAETVTSIVSEASGSVLGNALEVVKSWDLGDLPPTMAVHSAPLACVGVDSLVNAILVGVVSAMLVSALPSSAQTEHSSCLTRVNAVVVPGVACSTSDPSENTAVSTRLSPVGGSSGVKQTVNVSLYTSAFDAVVTDCSEMAVTADRGALPHLPPSKALLLLPLTCAPRWDNGKDVSPSLLGLNDLAGVVPVSGVSPLSFPARSPSTSSVVPVLVPVSEQAPEAPTPTQATATVTAAATSSIFLPSCARGKTLPDLLLHESRAVRGKRVAWEAQSTKLQCEAGQQHSKY